MLLLLVVAVVFAYVCVGDVNQQEI